MGKSKIARSDCERVEGKEKTEKGKNVTTPSKWWKVTLEIRYVQSIGCSNNFYFRLCVICLMSTKWLNIYKYTCPVSQQKV